MMPLSSGTVFNNRYRIEEVIGDGGTGIVYRAEDLKLQRPAAIKILPEGFEASAEARGRFQKDMRNLASLSHPYIVNVYDFGTSDGRVYAAMEFLEGETLRQRLERSRLSLSDALDIGILIFEGLTVAHNRGILH